MIVFFHNKLQGIGIKTERKMKSTAPANTYLNDAQACGKIYKISKIWKVTDMNMIGTQNIETKRCLLRRIRLEDYKMMYENWAKYESVCRYFPFDPIEEITVYREKVRNLLYARAGSLEQGNHDRGSSSRIGIRIS